MKTSQYDNVIDLRDLIADFEELEGQKEDGTIEEDENLVAYYSHCKALLDELKGYGGDEQWRGSWYPITLVSDDYFRDYAEQLAEDIGSIQHNASWPYTHIDWDAAAESLKEDYCIVYFDDQKYWYR